MTTGYGFDRLYEPWSSDPKRNVGGVTYLKSTTSLNFTQNAQDILNFRPEYAIPDTSGLSVIRYRVDQEGGKRGSWTGAFDGPYPVWPGAQSFNDMTYPGTATPVVGTTGPVPGVTPDNTTCYDGTFYHRGVLDDFNDEWHTIAVADDDGAVPFDGTQPPGHLANHIGPLAGGGAHNLYQSDGKCYHFVVNPLTPCLAFICGDASAQFYTTPAKVYFVPKIHAQTTYFDGNVTLEIAALNRVACQYSLVVEGDPVSWNDYTAPIDISALTADTNFTLSYRIGGGGQIKTRTIRRAHAVYPSDAEDHPYNMLWTDAAGLAAIKARIDDTAATTPYRLGPGANVYKIAYDVILANDAGARPAHDGCRTRSQITHEMPGVATAFNLLVYGFGDATAENLVHDVMLDNTSCLAPVGNELNHDGGTPTQEWMQAGGYYTFGQFVGKALIYTWLIATFRTTLGKTRGWTPVDDYQIRDLMAADVHMAALYNADPYTGWLGGVAGKFDTNMWSTAWSIGAMAIAAVLTEYDTTYYGTSGSPLGSEPTPHLDAPFPDEARTWWDWTTSKTATVLEAPNLTKRSGIWGTISDSATTPHWHDRADYFSGYDAMGGVFYFLCNFRHHYDGVHFDNVDRAIVLGTTNDLPADMHSGGDPLTCTAAWADMMNHNFPDAAINLDGGYITPASVAYGQPDALWKGGIVRICLFEDDWGSL